MAGTTAAAPKMGVIPNPVPGGTFTDTFGACRGTNCERRHMGIDIFAPGGSLIQSPVAGHVVKTGTNGLGGNAVWVAGNDGRFYYFAHLRDIVAKAGQQVGVGTKLGTVGNTGDASGGATHLHFSINGKVGAENPVVNPFLVIDRGAGTGPKIGTDYAGRPIDTSPQTSTTTGEGSYGADTGTNKCLIKFPGVAGVGDFCILNESKARAVKGAACLLAGGVLMTGGVALLAVYGFQSNAARLALKGVGAPGQMVDQRRTTKAKAGEAQEAADVRAQRRNVQSAELAERESRIVQRRSESAGRSRSRDAARAGRTLPGEQAF